MWADRLAEDGEPADGSKLRLIVPFSYPRGL